MARRQSKTEAAISDGMMAFQHKFVGRGPDRIRTRIVEDLVIVRSFGVFTPAEKQLVESCEGRRGAPRYRAFGSGATNGASTRGSRLNRRANQGVSRMDEAHNERRCTAGDTIKLKVVLDCKANLREVRVVFAHRYEETMTIVGRGKPYPISDRATDAAKRSRVDVEITIPRGKTLGIYKLDRIGYETAGGALGHLAEDDGLVEASQIYFEVVREPRYTPKLVDIDFAEG